MKNRTKKVRSSFSSMPSLMIRIVLELIITSETPIINLVIINQLMKITNRLLIVKIQRLNKKHYIIAEIQIIEWGS